MKRAYSAKQLGHTCSWRRRAFWFRFPRSGPWQENLDASCLFGKWHRKYLERKWGSERDRKLAKKPLLTKHILTVGNWSWILLCNSKGLRDTCTSEFSFHAVGDLGCAHTESHGRCWRPCPGSTDCQHRWRNGMWQPRKCPAPHPPAHHHHQEMKVLAVRGKSGQCALGGHVERM